MTLYEIDNAILDCVDDETGEVIDFDKLDKLTMQRDQKLEGAALAVKNLTAEAEAIKAEEKRLADRRKVLENKAEGYKGWLSNTLAGEKFETARVSCRFKRSKKTVVDDNKFCAWAISHDRDDLLIYADPKPDKNKIKAAVKAGETIPAVSIKESLSLSIK